VQGQRFKSDDRVLNLRCYDMILGEDWLEAVCPVWVDYTTKAMRIIVKGKRVALHGIRDNIATCPSISARKLLSLIQNGGITCCMQLCSEPKEMLPSDECQSLCVIQSADAVTVPEPVQ
jgi:hypothetical protein